MKEIKFRAWDESQKYMAIQGTPDLETLQSFMFHYSDKILMQFTGLKDCNGKDIYEGDILENPEGIKGTVEFLNGSFCLNSNGYYVLNNGYLKNKKVTGNIYENNSSKS